MESSYAKNSIDPEIFSSFLNCFYLRVNQKIEIYGDTKMTSDNMFMKLKGNRKLWDTKRSKEINQIKWKVLLPGNEIALLANDYHVYYIPLSQL